MPPGEWLLAERLVRARELLETTAHSIESIAGATGFGGRFCDTRRGCFGTSLRL